jgi:actin-related protein 3
MDCGTGQTKLGFAGNAEVTCMKHLQSCSPYFRCGHQADSEVCLMQPSFVIPTAIRFGEARPGAANSSSKGGDPTDFCIGEKATSHGSAAHWPIRHGVVENWSHMERFWQHSIHRHERRALANMQTTISTAHHLLLNLQQNTCPCMPFLIAPKLSAS